MDAAHPATDAEELLDLLVEHRRIRIARMVRATAMERELDLPTLLALQTSIETVERALAHEMRLMPASVGVGVLERPAVN